MVYFEPKNKSVPTKKKRYSRMPRAWFEDREKQSPIAYFRPITKNEYNAVVRNRIAERRCANQVKIYSQESRIVCMAIGRRIYDSRKIISELQQTTGYLDKEHQPRSHSQRRQQVKLTLDKYLAQSSTDEDKLAHVIQANSIVLPDINIKDSTAIKKQITFQHAEKKPVYLRHHTFHESRPRTTPSFPAKNPVEIQARNAVSSFAHTLDLPSGSSTEFSSRAVSAKPAIKGSSRKQLTPVVTEIIFKSDAGGRHSPEAARRQYSADYIAKLKASDPVFAKRHRQVQTAKQRNKAPEFDANDYNITIPVSKSTLRRRKNEIISSMQDFGVEKPRHYQIEMEKVDTKVKNYIKNLSIF